MNQNRGDTAAAEGRDRRGTAVLYLLGGAVLVLLFAAVLFAAARTGVCHADLLAGGEPITLAEGWVDEAGAPASMPLFLNWAGGVRHSYRLVLPEGDGSLRAPVLFFTSRYLNARFYLDGAPLGESLAKPSGVNSSQGKVFSILPLPEDCGGRELRLEVELLLGENVSYEIPAPVFSSRAGVISTILRDDLHSTLVDLFILCFSLILFLFGLQKGPLRRDGTFLFTGLFAICFALYSLCTADVLHLLCVNSYLIYLAEFLLLAFLPIPVVLVFAQQSRAPYRQLLRADLVLLFVNLFLQAGLHFFTPLEVRNTVFLTHGAMVVSLLIMVPTLLWGWDRGKRKWTVLTFSPIFIGTLVDIALFYFSKSFRSSFWVKIGVLLFVLLQTYSLIRDYLEHYESDLKNSMYRRMAYVDALTGLGNRAAFEQRIGELEQNLTRFSSLWCVCADINDLKRVNDSAGHAMGDQVIQGAAGVLQSLLCEDCSIYRTGGDEFVLFITDQPEQAVEEGRRRLERATESYNRSHEVKLSIAMGYDCFRFGGNDTVAELISRADARMYENKRRWKGENGLSAGVEK